MPFFTLSSTHCLPLRNRKGREGGRNENLKTHIGYWGEAYLITLFSLIGQILLEGGGDFCFFFKRSPTAIGGSVSSQPFSHRSTVPPPPYPFHSLGKPGNRKIFPRKLLGGSPRSRLADADSPGAAAPTADWRGL